MPTPPNWVVLIIWVAVAIFLVEIVRRALLRVARKWDLARHLVRRCTWPGFAAAVLVALNTVFTRSLFGDGRAELAFGTGVDRVLGFATIGCVTWLVIQAAYAVTDIVLDRLEGDSNRRARRTRTQITLVRRIAAAIVIIVALGAVLFSLPGVRTLGAGLLASAGIAGAVVGIAAQSTIGNMLAGLQLAFSDALRLDDVVVVNKEWGRVEELTLTYVVIRSWDERRLVFPVSYFTQNPFENWTRHGSRVIGHVYLRVDWSVPVAELRRELYEQLQENPLWDRIDWTLEVIDVLPSGLVELRALMSAADSASVWDLKCDIREHLVSFVREKYPEALPRFRVDTSNTP